MAATPRRGRSTTTSESITASDDAGAGKSKSRTRKSVSKSVGKSNTSKTVSSSSETRVADIIPSDVQRNLAFFSALLFTVPIAAYYVTLDHLFQGNTTLAALTAALAAKVILFAFVVFAFLEKDPEDKKDSKVNKGASSSVTARSSSSRRKAKTS